MRTAAALLTMATLVALGGAVWVLCTLAQGGLALLFILEKAITTA